VVFLVKYAIKAFKFLLLVRLRLYSKSELIIYDMV
jgi:hypothetical protein